MTKIADIHPPSGGQPLFICDFSPPRGAAYDDIDAAHTLAADCLSVPYNPGKSVYANSAFAAHSVRAATGKEVAFTIATRDMNILAAQSLLLGAAQLGLQNVLVVRGDNFTPAELRHTKPVNDRTTTSLIRSITSMNEGTDFRGRALAMQTDFCIGAAVDTNRDIDSEVASSPAEKSVLEHISSSRSPALHPKDLWISSKPTDEPTASSHRYQYFSESR